MIEKQIGGRRREMVATTVVAPVRMREKLRPTSMRNTSLKGA